MSVRVRFYGGPLQSCVLVTLGNGDAARRFLIGCGLGFGATVDDPGVRSAARGLFEDLRSEPSPLVVMASHTGRSVVAGFAADGWADVPVEQVWLPFSEGPDSAAVAARISLSGRADRLATMLEALKARESTTVPRQILDSCRRDAVAVSRLLGNWPSATIRFLGGEPAQGPGSEDLADIEDNRFVVGSATVSVLRSSENRQSPAAVHLPSATLGFAEQYRESQRRYVNRNLRAAEDHRMNLRTLGKVTAMSRLQPLSLAINLQQQHHRCGVTVHVRAGNDNLLVLADHQLDGTADLRRALGPRRSNSTEILVCSGVSGSSPAYQRMDAVVDVNGLARTRTERHWKATVADRWTEWAFHDEVRKQ